jgi:serine/threonine protein kinase
MVSGEVPFQGDTQAVLAQQLTQEPPHLSSRVADINPLFAELVAQMLAKDPAHRPQSMLELADSLEQCRTDFAL